MADIIGIPVFCIDGGFFVGQICDILVDGAGRALYALLPGEKWFMGLRALRLDDSPAAPGMLPAKGGDILPAASLEGEISALYRAAGKPIYSIYGELLGRVEGIELLGGRVKAALSGGREYGISVFGADAYIDGEGAPPAMPQGSEGIDTAPPDSIIAPQPGGGDGVSFGTAGIAGQAAFLLGRRAGRTVMGSGGVIVTPGQLIDEAMISRAVSEGKIGELMLCL